MIKAQFRLNKDPTFFFKCQLKKKKIKLRKKKVLN